MHIRNSLFEVHDRCTCAGANDPRSFPVEGGSTATSCALVKSSTFNLQKEHLEFKGAECILTCVVIIFINIQEFKLAVFLG